MLKDSFCSSPWFHIKIGLNGDYHVCRWAQETVTGYNIADTSLTEFYNSQPMRQLRAQFLQGQRPTQCETCYYQDSFGKVSGRIRQLNKSAIRQDHFELSLRASPHWPLFEHSWDNLGASSHYPTDLQIDLGNLCNSACVMCDPRSSSRLQTEYYQLHQLKPQVFAHYPKFVSWATDAGLVEKFVKQVRALPYVRYIHFLGGETLYNQAFYTICEQLDSDMIVGTTTNGTIYNERLEQLIPRFREFHLGISIESVTALNDYVRWPSQIDQVLINIQRFVDLRNRYPGLHLELRITPNLFTISELDGLFDFMLDHDLIAESCNILYKPECLRMELLPEDIRSETIERMQRLCDRLGAYTTQVNTRRSDLSKQVIAQTANEYLNFLKTYQRPDNYIQLQNQLKDFLHGFEQVHKNSILDYAPRYTQFLRSIGY